MLGSLLSRRMTRGRGRRAAGDEFIELVEPEEPVGLGSGELVATGPGRASHTEAVDQEQHQRSGCPPSQSLTTYGPHPALAIERFHARWTQLELVPRNMIRANAIPIYPFGLWHCKSIGRESIIRESGRLFPCRRYSRLHQDRQARHEVHPSAERPDEARGATLRVRRQAASQGPRTRVPHIRVLEAGCDSAYSSIESIQQIERRVRGLSGCGSATVRCSAMMERSICRGKGLTGRGSRRRRVGPRDEVTRWIGQIE